MGSTLVYWLLTALVKDTLPVRITACLLGLIVCYAFGTAWFMAVYTAGPMDVGAAVAMCVIPFILPDLVKIGLAVTLAQRVRKVSEMRKSRPAEPDGFSLYTCKGQPHIVPHRAAMDRGRAPFVPKAKSFVIGNQSVLAGQDASLAPWDLASAITRRSSSRHSPSHGAGAAYLRQRSSAMPLFMVQGSIRIHFVPDDRLVAHHAVHKTQERSVVILQ